MVLTNPPFGKKSSIAIVNEEGDLEKEDTAYERQVGNSGVRLGFRFSS